MWVRKEASNGRLEPPPEVAHKAGDKDKTPQVRTTENETLVKIVGQQKKKGGETETGSKRRNKSFYFFPKLWQNEVKVSVAEVCARVFLRVSDLPRVVVRPLGCQNRGFSYSTGCNLCANTPALIFPLGNLWFWSIYLQEQSCTVIPCVSFLVRPGPCFSGCAFYRLPFFFFFIFLPTNH